MGNSAQPIAQAPWSRTSGPGPERLIFSAAPSLPQSEKVQRSSPRNSRRRLFSQTNNLARGHEQIQRGCVETTPPQLRTPPRDKMATRISMLVHSRDYIFKNVHFNNKERRPGTLPEMFISFSAVSYTCPCEAVANTSRDLNAFTSTVQGSHF